AAQATVRASGMYAAGVLLTRASFTLGAFDLAATRVAGLRSLRSLRPATRVLFIPMDDSLVNIQGESKKVLHRESLMGQVKTFRDLIVWQKGMKLVTEIYQVTSSFP